MHVLDRFVSKIDTDDETTECWPWTAKCDNGYGRFWYDGSKVLAHRWSYERFVGPIPEGLEMDHLCHNTACVNPDHLEPVTRQENINRRRTNPCGWGQRHRKKTHCPQGHPYSDENLYVRPDGKGRGCIICRNEAALRQRRKPSTT